MTGFEGDIGSTVKMVEAIKLAGDKVLKEAATQAEHATVIVETLLIESHAERVSDIVVAQAHKWGARVIGLGTHGRRGVKRMLLGSDAEQILRLSKVPVLLVRAQ
jgi:nucleotide-binding universal stress UspA family protein